jgi:protease-4
VILDPSFNLDLVGISLRAIFLGDALGRLGLEFDLVRVGEYKGAYEQLTSGKPSLAYQKALAETADSLYASLVERIAKSRNLSPSDVRAAIDEGPLLPERAMKLKIADRQAYPDEIEEVLSRHSSGNPVEPMDASDYLRAVGEGGKGARIAVVHIQGFLNEFELPVGFFPGRITSAEGVAAILRQIREDESIQGVILRINSPGGTLSAAERICREVEVTRKLKPVVASMGSMAASGGYYIACTADRIIAQPCTLTGSIGVFGGKVVIEKLLSNLSIHVAGEERGRRAGIFDPTRKLTGDEKIALERVVREGYRRFVDRVAVGRKMPFGDVDRLAQGRIWTGSQAAKNGLIDELGGLETAVAAVKKQARIAREKEVVLIPFPKRRSLFQLFRGKREEPMIHAGQLAHRSMERLLRQCGLDGRRAMALPELWMMLR